MGIFTGEPRDREAVDALNAMYDALRESDKTLLGSMRFDRIRHLRFWLVDSTTYAALRSVAGTVSAVHVCSNGGLQAFNLPVYRSPDSVFAPRLCVPMDPVHRVLWGLP